MSETVVTVNDWQLQRLKQSGVIITGKDLVVYIDPIETPADLAKADYLLISHEHADHCDPESIAKLLKPETLILGNSLVLETLVNANLEFDQFVEIEPGQDYGWDDLVVETTPAYNLDKFREPGQLYHPPGNEGVGFILHLGETKIFHMGDTDALPELEQIKNIDVLFIPVSGTYVMTPTEAVEFTKLTEPKLAIPMHWDKRVGGLESAEEFVELATSAGVKAQILLAINT